MYALYKIPFLDNQTRCYKNIIKISSMPSGPLEDRVRRVNLPKLSPFKNNCCDFQVFRIILYVNCKMLCNYVISISMKMRENILGRKLYL